MRRIGFVLVPALVIVFLAAAASAAGWQHEFSVKQYNDFHEVLHPLQHDALPKNDFKTIRHKSGVLIMHGRRIVKLGVPRGTKKEKVAEFKAGLTKFNAALAKFRSDVKSGTDEQLKVSYSAVHDTFEELADRLPR
ncbi:MAG TPA: hypothetical protein VN643_20450 [Pyrinomonadaceae bacterium]|nr:hypothetical protein [Pyrinomonadaceae bacterium]